MGYTPSRSPLYISERRNLKRTRHAPQTTPFPPLPKGEGPGVRLRVAALQPPYPVGNSIEHLVYPPLVLLQKLIQRLVLRE